MAIDNSLKQNKTTIPSLQLFLCTLSFRSCRYSHYTKCIPKGGHLLKHQRILCIKILRGQTKVYDLKSVCEDHEGHILPRTDEVFDDRQLSVDKWLSLRQIQMGPSCLPIAIEILTHHEDYPSARPSVLGEITLKWLKTSNGQF